MPIHVPPFLDNLLAAFLVEIDARGFLFATDSPSSTSFDIGEAVQGALGALSRRDSAIPLPAETPTTRATRGRILVLLPDTMPTAIYAICYSYTAVANADALDATLFASWALKLVDVVPNGPDVSSIESIDGNVADSRSMTWAMKCITEALDRLAAKHKVEPSMARLLVKEIREVAVAAGIIPKSKENKA